MIDGNMKTRRCILALTTLLSPLFAAKAQVQDSTVVHVLEEAVVSGWAGNTTARQSAVPITLISSGELAHYNASNIIDAISHAPGLSQVTTGSGISKPVIRGLGYNRVVVVNDGIRQEGQQWGDEHGIEIDPQSVSSVEIIKGPASLLYGSDAMSGVIIFHGTPTLMPGTIVSTMSNEYQSNNGMIANSIFNAGHVKDLVWDARISQKDAHSYRNKADGVVYNSGFSEKAASGLLGVAKDWGYSHLRLGIYSLVPGLVEGEREEDGSLANEGELGDRQYGHALPFQRILHGKAVLDNSVRIGAGNMKILAGYQMNDRQEFEESEEESGLHFRLHTLNYDVNYRSGETAGWKFLTGIAGMYQRSMNLGDEFLIPAYALNDLGAFATAQKAFERWTLSGGLRYDWRHIDSEALEDEGEMRFEDFRSDYTGLSGSLGASFYPVEGLQVKANVSRGFRAPNISELASNGVHEGTERYEVGSYDLKSEHSLQFDLGVDYTSEKIALSLSLFANRMSSFVFSQRSEGHEVIDDHDVFRFVQGNALLFGGEAGFDWTIVPGLDFENSFSYVSGRLIGVDDEESKWLPLIPAPRLNSSLSYSFNVPSPSLSNLFVQAGVEAYFTKNRVHAAYDTETVTPGYTLLNASAGMDINVKGRRLLTVVLNGENLTNAVYQNHLSRLKYTDVNPMTGKMGVFNMGINVGVKLLWNLEFASGRNQ